jgi:nickel/cobalt transporter (NicO) family protein
VTRRSRRFLIALALAAAAALALAAPEAFAQSGRNPFAIAGGESVGAASGLAGLILSWQNKFHQELQAAAKALKTSPEAFWTLAGASLFYGVFHAAGPGHGKAVLASYMIASRAALGRGMALAALAALLQGAVAIALVGAAAIAFGATATQMKWAASKIELASYAAIAVLGASLVWKKGAAFLAAAHTPPLPRASTVFCCEAVGDPAHIHSDACGHFHIPDAAALESGFSWSDALGTVVAAGLRPCSGAILILVFTLAQGRFLTGVVAVLLMSAGTAATTGALAAAAVYARETARRFSSPDSRRAKLAGAGAQLLAAVAVLILGLALLVGSAPGAGA